MSEIPDELVREVVANLAYMSTHLPGHAATPTSVASSSPFTVQEVFDAFEGLPGEHPLRQSMDPDAVKLGYAKLTAWNYCRDQPAIGLGVHVVAHMTPSPS